MNKRQAKTKALFVASSMISNLEIEDIKRDNPLLSYDDAKKVEFELFEIHASLRKRLNKLRRNKYNKALKRNRDKTLLSA